MVRHHVKKKKSDGTKKSSGLKKQQEEKKKLEEELDNLDRFAGSSDEEDGSSDGDEDEDGGAQEMDGSNEEEDGSASGDSDDDYDDVYKEGMKNAKAEQPVKKTIAKKQKDEDSKEEEGGGSSSDSENDYKDGEGGQSDDDDDMSAGQPRNAKSAGMANAMSRILGGQSMMKFQQPPGADDANDESKKQKDKSVSKPVILSKTTTPLQRLQAKIKTEEQALRQKRQSRRVENLSAMRLPLAPTAGMSADKLFKQKKKKSKRKRDAGEEDPATLNALAIANEIESERTHRRIATRGVVALFNAISKHRAAVVAEATAKEEEKRRKREEGTFKKKKSGEDDDGVSSKTKHGFLDMIKKSAVPGSSGGGESKDEGSANGVNGSKEAASSKGSGSKGSVGWSALKDDFMMNSKLKDWDKISDDDDDEPNGDYDSDAPPEPEPEVVKNKYGKRDGRGKRR